MSFLPYALEYVEIIQKGFLALPLPEFLLALGISVNEVGDVPEMTEPFTKAYELVSERTLKLLDSEDNRDAEELYKRFFGLTFRYTKDLSSVILSSKTLEETLKLAGTTIGKNQLEVPKALCKLLKYLFLLTCENPQSETEKVNLELEFL